MISSNTCPCGRNQSYTECCGIIHKNQAAARTAEDLMRSRYTAFTSANGDYLMQSHHAKTRKISDKREIVDWAKSVQWLKLEVIDQSKGLAFDTDGTVEFKAIFMERGQIQAIHENSSFVKENGTWFYMGISN